MDHIIFLGQDRLDTFRVNFQSFSVSWGNNVTIWRSDAQRCLTDLLERTQSFSIGARVGEKLHQYVNGFSNSWLVLRMKDSWNQCIRFLITEVGRHHIYFGAMCFVFGSVVGIGIGTRIRESCVVPHKMKAIIASSYHGLEAISYVEDLEAPKVYQPSQVLIQVKAASIDSIDIKVSEGYGKALRKRLNKYNPNSSGEFPVILGRDCSGIVVAIGKKVSSVRPGDEVWLSLPVFSDGTLREYVVADERYVALKPHQMSHEAAAALPSDLTTAWNALSKGAGLGEFTTAGKRILVHSGTCGVGLVAIQLIRAWGGHVTTTVPPNAASLVHSLGADHIILEDSRDLWEELEAQEKFDVIFSAFGCGETERKLSKLCTKGGLVVTSSCERFPEDSMGVFFGTLFNGWLKLKTFIAKEAWLRDASHYGVSNKPLKDMAPLISTGQIRSVVDRTFALPDAEFAFSHVAKGACIGRTVIRFSDPFPGRNLGIRIWQDL